MTGSPPLTVEPISNKTVKDDKRYIAKTFLIKS